MIITQIILKILVKKKTNNNQGIKTEPILNIVHKATLSSVNEVVLQIIQSNTEWQERYDLRMQELERKMNEVQETMRLHVGVMNQMEPAMGGMQKRMNVLWKIHKDARKKAKESKQSKESESNTKKKGQ